MSVRLTCPFRTYNLLQTSKMTILNFSCIKNGHYMEILTSPLYKMMSPLRFFIPLVSMRFCGYVFNFPKYKNVKRLIPYLLEKMVFLASKITLFPSSIGKGVFFSTLYVMILQMAKNKCLKFGGHIDIQINYKIIWLEVRKKVPILHHLPCFQ
jgi:hypothetical protein